MDDNQFIDIKKLQEWIKLYRRFDRYEWYKRDLLRKRPNRKKGRNLYHGILDYRRRVGQREDKLNFRGIARMYDMLRIIAIQKDSRLAAKIPDLHMRFLGLLFPPREFEAMTIARPITKSIMTQFYQDIGAMRIKVPPLMVGELARTLDGEDAVLARVKEAEPSDAVISFAIATLRVEEKSNK